MGRYLTIPYVISIDENKAPIQAMAVYIIFFWLIPSVPVTSPEPITDEIIDSLKETGIPKKVAV